MQATRETDRHNFFIYYKGHRAKLGIVGFMCWIIMIYIILGFRVYFLWDLPIFLEY